jgi:hypothetical protein
MQAAAAGVRSTRAFGGAGRQTLTLDGSRGPAGRRRIPAEDARLLRRGATLEPSLPVARRRKSGLEGRFFGQADEAPYSPLTSWWASFSRMRADFPERSRK